MKQTKTNWSYNRFEREEQIFSELLNSLYTQEEFEKLSPEERVNVRNNLRLLAVSNAFKEERKLRASAKRRVHTVAKRIIRAIKELKQYERELNFLLYSECVIPSWEQSSLEYSKDVSEAIKILKQVKPQYVKLSEAELCNRCGKYFIPPHENYSGYCMDCVLATA